MRQILRDIFLFFQRDLRIAGTYRSPFILEAVEALFGAAMFYYVARFVDSPALRDALPQGKTYFAYSLAGFVFFDYLNAALDTFDRSLQEARDSGTLEPLLVTQVSLPVILIGSAFYPFAATTLRIAVYLGWAAALLIFPSTLQTGWQLSPCCLPRCWLFRDLACFPLRIFCFSSGAIPQSGSSWGYRVSRVACSFR